MRTLRTLLVGPLVLATTLTSGSFAQERHVVDPAKMASAISQRVGNQDADRTAIREALARQEVRDVAAKAGINSTLSDSIARIVNQIVQGPCTLS